MKLYYSPGACSLAPHIILRELGIPVELARVDMQRRTLADGTDYHTVNPLGYVPVLEQQDGWRMREAGAILQYLADRAPELQLAPPNGSPDRYRLQEWLSFVATELHQRVSPLFDTPLSAPMREKVVARIERRLTFLAAELSERQWLLGDRFTVVDAYLFAVLGWSDYLRLDLSRWPALQAYQGRVAQRPAVRAAMQAEGLAVAN